MPSGAKKFYYTQHFVNGAGILFSLNVHHMNSWLDSKTTTITIQTNVLLTNYINPFARTVQNMYCTPNPLKKERDFERIIAQQELMHSRSKYGESTEEPRKT